MQCKEWDDANSKLFKESHDEAVHKNPYKSRLYELISASLGLTAPLVLRVVVSPLRGAQRTHFEGRLFYGQAKGQLWLTCAFYAEYAQ
jgi:cytochrome c oxidase assembly factor CtaG